MWPELLSSVFLLMLLIDPLGNITIFNSLLQPFSPSRRRRIIVREGLIAMAVLMAFVYVGDWILQALRLTPVALEITGGLMLFIIALRMVFPAPEQAHSVVLDHEPLIVPMAIPLIAGPASLATVLLASHQSTHSQTMVAAILIACLLNIIVLLMGQWLLKLFGKTGMAAMERLMGLALTTMAVQMIMTGIKKAFMGG